MTAHRVLIVGGTRFIGPRVVESLVASRCEVTVFHRGQSEPDGFPDVRHIHGDRSDFASHRAALARVAPDVVIDMVPLRGSDAAAVIAAFGAARLVAISSQDVYRAYGVLRRLSSGPVDPVPLAETAPLRAELYPYRGEVAPDSPLHDYDKIPVERLVLDAGGTVLRLPAVYGAADRQHRTAAYLRPMLDGRPAILLGEQFAAWRWTRGYVDNIAAAIVLAATETRATGRVYNLGEEVARSEAEWVGAIGRAAGWDGAVVAVPDAELPSHLRSTENFAQPLVADTGRIRAELGYREPVERATGLERTLRWEQVNLPAPPDDLAARYAAEDALLSRRRRPGRVR
jgi:nucleoside-diphosphate-sugar epimerase